MRWNPNIPTENLDLKYTPGGELMDLKTLEPYIGVYYIKEKKILTYPKTPQNRPKPLVKLNDHIDFRIYQKIKGTKFDLTQLPQETAVWPTEKDYKKGYIDRYFTRKVNDRGAPIKEVDKDYKQYLKGMEI